VTERELLADLLDATGTGRSHLRLAAAAGAVASLSAVALLGLSGWFLASAALAGAAGVVAAQGFNYLIPSAAIRLLAILRTAGRYGERLLGHQAALEGMAALRARLFARRAAIDTRADSDDAGAASAALLDDIAALEDIVIRRPAAFAGLAGAALSVALVALAGWKAAAALALALAALPVLLRYLTLHLTAKPSAQLADAVVALRKAMTEFAAVRAEIAAYGLAPRIMEALAPLEAAHDSAKTQLAKAEAMVAAVQTLYTAAVVAMVFALSDGAAPIIALAVLASGAGVEATGGLTRNALRKAGIERSLARLAELSRSPEVAAPYEVRPTPSAPLMLGATAIAPGERVAISGISGSGKTRLIEALAGLRPAVHLLRVAGVPVAQLSADDLRRQFALAPQDPALLVGTVADNLRIAAPGIDADMMLAALRIVALEARIAAAPDGLNTWLSSDGGFLSGGERKRLALARALLARRPWLLLDEPTEGLDSGTEQAVIDNLDAWLDQTGTGLVMVSHRPDPLRLASRILSIGSL
jgi:ATP-binding cassette subfamily C protein CydC